MIVEKWWITDDWFDHGGVKILGPFESKELALRVRSYVEHGTQRTYYVDKELAAVEPDKTGDTHE
jgi:hypothetical protein